MSRPDLSGARPTSAAAPSPSASFCTDLADILHARVAAFAAARKECGLPANKKGGEFLEYVCSLQAPTEAQVEQFVGAAVEQYARKLSEASTPLGAIAAQSLGEPGTQMTLKTFHFAGVASMNVTLGVPRIKEIINASKNISTPIMHIALATDSNEHAARVVKVRLEKTMLKTVVKCIKLQVSNGEPRVVVTLDMAVINALSMHVDAGTVRAALIAERKSRVKEHQVRLLRHDKLVIIAADDSRERLASSLQLILKAIPEVVVAGISTVSRAVIQRRKYSLLVEGTDFRSVLTSTGVDGRLSETNNVTEVESVLGIEAARSKIMTEIKYIFDQYGMGIDYRHIMLLADLMTCKGTVLGITRFGIVDMKESILHSASFERTTDQLFEAAAKGMQDHVTGVSESIILGMQMPIGTGLFQLRHDLDLSLPPPRLQPLLA